MATISNTNYFSPTQIAGCSLWLDAADVSSLFKDTAGTQLVTTNGDIVRRINDKSGNSRNATTSATTNVYTTSQSNGNSAIQVPSDSGFATPSFTISSANTCTLFIVALQNSPISGNVALFRNNTGASNTLRLQLESAFARINVNSLTMAPTLPITGLGFPNIYSVGFDSSAITSFFNGIPATAGQSGTSDGSLASPTTYAFATNTGMNGFLYEVILYNTNLTVNQRQQVEGYLAWKWGTQSSLPTTHPYFYNPMIPNLILPAPLANPLTTTNTTLITMNPTQISGCSLWLDAADSSTMSFSGAIVTQWRDKSGNSGRNATAVSNPTLSNINGLQAMNMTNGPYFTGAVSITGTTLTCFAVASSSRIPNNGPSDQRIVSLARTGTNDYGDTRDVVALFNSWTADKSDITTYRSFAKKATASISLNTAFIAVSQYDGTSGFLWKDGTAGSLTGVASSGSFAIQSYGIGNQATPSGELWQGTIGEVIVFNTSLSTQQRQQIEGYLAWKWGLQANLQTTHPYFYNPLIPNLILPSQVYSLAPSFSPARFSGLALWLDAADTNTITQSGGSVTRWNDKSGNGRNATTVNSIQYIIDSQNRNAIYINNSQSFNIPSFAPSATSQISVFCVINQLQTVGAGNVDMIRTSSYANFTMNLAISTNNYNLFLNNASVTSATTFSVNNRVTICEIVFNVSSGNTFVNGSTTTTFSAAAGTALTTSQTLVIGGNTTINMNYYELLFYSTTLTTNQRQQIEGYLAWKWGLQTSLPTTHPYFFAPPS